MLKNVPSGIQILCVCWKATACDHVITEAHSAHTSSFSHITLFQGADWYDSTGSTTTSETELVWKHETARVTTIMAGDKLEVHREGWAWLRAGVDSLAGEEWQEATPIEQQTKGRREHKRKTTEDD